MFSKKQEEILSNMTPENAELIRESLTSKHRMHMPHMGMFNEGSVLDDQSSEEVVLREKKKKKEGY